MEDLVAVAIEIPGGARRYVVTYGRIQDTVDPAPLEALVLGHASKFGLRQALSARVCLSLQEASNQPYFFEALVKFAGAPPPFGPGYANWRDDIAAQMASGGRLYYLGDPGRLPTPP